MANFNYINAGESLTTAQRILIHMMGAEHQIELCQHCGNIEQEKYYRDQLSKWSKALADTLQNVSEPFTKYITA